MPGKEISPNKYTDYRTSAPQSSEQRTMAIDKRKLSSSASLTNAKTRRLSTSVPDWSQLHSDMLLLIFNRLSFIDVLQAKSVSSHWYSVAEQLIKPYTKLHPIPWLLIPPQEEEGKKRRSGAKLFSVEEGKVYSIKNGTASKVISDFSCSVGSSHGHIIVFNCERSSLFVFNPLTGSETEFPAMNTFLGKVSDCKDGGSNYHIKFEYVSNGPSGWFMFSRHMREHFIQKAILSSDPCHSKSYGLVLICRKNMEIAFCRSGGRRESPWMYLDCRKAPYEDILCHENRLYVLGRFGTTLDVWDLTAGPFPVRTMSTVVSRSWSKALQIIPDVSTNLYTQRFYLVESCGRVLLVVRHVGEFVDDEDGRAVDEGAEPLVCPYKTLLFSLFRMDFEQKTWLEMDSLDDQAVFLGGNHSVSGRDFPGCECDSIYFTDDYWIRMNKDYPYARHDMGVYNLKDKDVKHFHQFEALRIQPPPCWFLPNPW